MGSLAGSNCGRPVAAGWTQVTKPLGGPSVNLDMGIFQGRPPHDPSSVLPPDASRMRGELTN
jgi:hypothetical protein